MRRGDVLVLAVVVFVLGVMLGGVVQKKAGPGRAYTPSEVCGLALASFPAAAGAEGQYLDTWQASVQSHCAGVLDDPAPGTKDALG